MISLPLVSAEYCRERNGVKHIDYDLSMQSLLARPLEESCRREIRTVLDIPEGVSGHFIYPPGGGVDWHDDGGFPGWRVYLAWSETGQSGMIFEEDGIRRICQDKAGWNMRKFLAPTWHCVWTDCWRYSIGLLLPCTH